MESKLKSPLDFLAEALKIDKESTPFKLAKILEEVRIVTAYKAAQSDMSKVFSIDSYPGISGQEYYDETYKN